MKDIALVYMVAGLSSRFEGKIKQFAKVSDEETLIEYSLSQALKAGFSKIIFIVGEKTEKPFKQMFGDNYKGIHVLYVFQSFDKEERDRPWGTSDALYCIKDIIDCSFVICNGDNIYGEEAFKILTEHLKNKNTYATLGYNLGKSLSDKGSVNRGIYELNGNVVKSIVEVFDITKENLKEKNLSEDTYCSMNIFAFHPQILDLLKNILIAFKDKNKEDRRIECLLPNDIGNLIRDGKIIMDLYPVDNKILEVTRPGDETIIRKILKNKNKNKTN